MHYSRGGAGMTRWLEDIRWNADGLVAAIAQDAESGDVLMLAWMSRESLARTLDEGEAVYWSRSRQRLWKKGEQSGHLQRIADIRLDCDGDTLLLKVQQVGGIACHTGRKSCFYKALRDASWESVEPVLEAPEKIYRDD
jgi:phosphoribosyl-AMP cyclohydrolase